MNQGETSSDLSIRPLKRRRGRPPKDPSLKRTPGGIKQYHLPQRPNPPDPTEPTVGQAVTGVVEATLDAGYLLNVRIGNSPMSFRGIVFKPGQYVPVTAENDVAPHLEMIRRNDLYNPDRLAIQTAPPKRKYTSRRAVVTSAPPVHPVRERGSIVPVVLEPVDFPNGSPEFGQVGQVLDFGDKDVHMVEPLTMLPPEGSIPAGKIFLGGQAEASHNAPQGDRVKESSDIENGGSSETSDSLTDNGKESVKSPLAEDSLSGIVLTQEVENAANGAFSNGVSVTKPFFDCGPGRMTDLLQAVEMKDNQVHFAEQPIPGSEVGLHEMTITTEADPFERSGP